MEASGAAPIRFVELQQTGTDATERVPPSGARGGAFGFVGGGPRSHERSYARRAPRSRTCQSVARKAPTQMDFMAEMDRMDELGIHLVHKVHATWRRASKDWKTAARSVRGGARAGNARVPPELCLQSGAR